MVVSDVTELSHASILTVIANVNAVTLRHEVTVT